MNLLQKYSNLTIKHMRLFNALTDECMESFENEDVFAYHAGAIDALLAVLRDVSECDVCYTDRSCTYYHSIEVNGEIYEV